MKLYGNKSTKKSKAVRIIALALAAIAVLSVGSWAAFEFLSDPPAQKNSSISSQTDTQYLDGSGANASYTVDKTNRKDGAYTFLIAGEDDEAGGTDVIMVGMLNTVEGSLNLVSIPRDTLVNVPWAVKKANSYKNMYTYLEQDYDNYVDAMIAGVKKLIGYEVDSYVTVDLKAFVTMVDAVGGVEFDVPQNMSYNDPEQDLTINLQAGMQLLDGQKAMQLIRYRSTYIAGDLQRIDVQHDFLNALAGELLSAQGVFAIDDLVGVFQENVDTNLTTSNIMWYAKEMLKLKSGSISFFTAANTTYTYNGGSYVTLNVDQWLEQINLYINPYNQDITIEDLDILTQNDNGDLYSTVEVSKQGAISVAQ